MELDEMKQAWQALDRRLEKQYALDLQIFRDAKRDKAHRALRPLRIGQAVQILAGACLVLLAAPFWIDHLAAPHLMVCGMLLHGYGLLLLVTAARNLYLQSRIDYGAPVLEIQRRLAQLRSWRLKEALLHGVTGCFLWVPVMIVVLARQGVDLWLHAPSVVWWSLANSAVALALLGAVVGVSRRPGWERFREALDNTGVGRSVRNVHDMLEEIARFERE